jgi:hypothetical protein
MITRTITNLYKQSNTFRCVHDVHQHFKSNISPFHILKEKKCYPHGCFYFQWKCKLLAKQNKCFRNFTRVGKECFNCKYFSEQKIHQYPEVLLDKQEKIHFFEQFEIFESWVEKLKHQRVSCEGVVSSINPDFVLYKNNNSYTPSLKGFLIRFEQGYLDNQFFQDPFYLSISTMTQNKLLIRTGDSLEFTASLRIDKGRFKFFKSGKFQFYNRGNSKPVRNSDILVALKVATIQPGQPEKCMRCTYGSLADIITDKPGPGRAILCLKGIHDFQCCICNIESNANENNGQCMQTNTTGLKCHYTI